MIQLLFSLLFSVASAHVSIKCEAEASPRTTYVVSLLQKALAAGDLEPEDVEAYATATVWFDPFAKQNRSIRNIHFKQRFVRATANMSAEERAATQRLAARVVQKERWNRELIKVARQNTKMVIAPKLMQSMHLPQNVTGPDGTDLILGWVDGRPIFTGTFGNVGRIGMVYNIWLDPLGSEPVHKMREFKYVDSVGRMALGYNGGEAWGLVFEHDFFWNSKAKSSAPGEAIVNQYLRGSKALGEFEIFHTARGTKVLGFAASRSSIGGDGSLYEFDVWDKNKKPKHLSNFNVRIFKKVNLKGKQYALYAGFDKRITLYDVEEGGVKYSVVAHLKECSSLHDPTFELFSDGGKLKLLVTPKSFAGLEHVCAVDLESGEVTVSPHPIDSLNGLTLVSLRKVPHAYFFDNGHLVLIDLRTFQPRKIPLLATNSTRIRVVEMLGRPHLIWGSRREIKVFDIDAEQMIVKLDIGFEPSHIQAFRMNGSEYALARDANGLVYHVIRLTEPAP